MRLRFPQIEGMWTASDALLTLHCRVQASIAAQTHAVRVSVQRADNSTADAARSASSAPSAAAAATGTVAHGGSQLQYHTEISLGRIRRRGGGTAVEPLAAGATVRLGEELLLRAQVRADDGWNGTRLADVQLLRYAADGRLLRAATVLNAAGCVPPRMRTVCPSGGAVFEPPLGHRLAFRAVMFRGMRSGDAMVLSVRVVGCVRLADCAVVSASFAIVYAQCYDPLTNCCVWMCCVGQYEMQQRRWIGWFSNQSRAAGAAVRSQSTSNWRYGR